jgi:hypothetical protein
MRNTGIIISREFGRLQKEIMLCFKFLSQHLPGGSGENLKQKENHFRTACDSTNRKPLL